MCWRGGSRCGDGRCGVGVAMHVPDAKGYEGRPRQSRLSCPRKRASSHRRAGDQGRSGASRHRPAITGSSACADDDSGWAWDVQVGAAGEAATLPYALPPPPTPPHKGEGSRPSARQRSTTSRRVVSKSPKQGDGGRRILREASHRSQACAGCVNLPALRLLRMRRRDHRRRVALTCARVSSSRASPSRRRSAATCRNARRSATSRRRP